MALTFAHITNTGSSRIPMKTFFSGYSLHTPSETVANLYRLDYGGGRYLDLPTCSRAQLDRECVRYLSREERMAYLVKVDSDGRLCWAKNGQRIDTTTEYADSKHGIVPATHPDAITDQHQLRRASTASSSSTSTSYTMSTSSADSIDARRYANPEPKHGNPFRKHIRVSPGTIFNHLLRKTVRKNTWIFVADTSFRLYVGIKQSGAFQHSSFLHGARVSAAGLIKIKDGKLKRYVSLSYQTGARSHSDHPRQPCPFVRTLPPLRLPLSQIHPLPPRRWRRHVWDDDIQILRCPSGP